MKIDFSNANVFDKESLKGKLSSLELPSVAGSVIDFSGYDILPAFIDVHVHFREPGFSYKERVATGSLAGAMGGYYAVCTMPNLNPVPDTLDNLKKQLEIINRDSVIKALPFGAITKGQNGKELSDMEAMAPFVCGFSDDGRGVDNSSLMREAMIRAKALDKVISAHCEDGAQIKDSKEAEWKQIERDIKLVSDIGCKYHVCHISTKESVDLIREAKKNGVNITCETAPHYLTLTDADRDDTGRFKMNPPLRDAIDRDALIEGICDGTVDMIATDHAPHSAEEKGRGFKGSLNGIVGLETAFPVMYTSFVKKGIITLDRLVHLMSINPANRFGIETDGFTVYDLNEEYTVNPEEFATMGRSSPFAGNKVYGRCLATVVGNKWAYISEKIKKDI
ncbi:MAG: dihydroorotase [Clostridia bacterium]|nr:dihydroorotase [Clostridia bacterium]